MRNIKTGLLIILITIVSTSFAQTWENPHTLSGEIGGIGDPYIMKYRGTYYLYASNNEKQVLRCWESKDLINWSDAIVCSTDDKIRGAYAPEVFYWNGVFYMYNSPFGGGHYVLTSTSPTGPFVAVTENIGKVIDGSVFIDDDGKWYFYHADGAGIFGCPMPTPTTIGAGVNLGAHMSSNWTEGPCVIKRNGIYYLLYTGNHVISQGYRIDYATNTTKNPISRYTPQAAQNPILVKSEGEFSGLGHGTAFIGPDLDTYYFTYHSLVRTVGGQPQRKLNFDRIAWNGDKLSIIGHTDWPQQVPQLATTDYFDRTEIGSDWTMPNGGDWSIRGKDLMRQKQMDNVVRKAIFTKASASDYTAEFTIREYIKDNNSAKLGAVFSYSDEQNYGTVLYNTHTKQLEINFLIDNVWGTAQYFNLPAEFKQNAWHSMRIEKQNTNYKFFIDGMLKATLTSELKGGHVGYMTSECQGDFGYIALSDKVNGSGILDTYKPVPGNISAIHHNSGGESVNTSINPEGGYHISESQAGEWYKYNINVEATGAYNIGIRYAASASCQIKIYQGETDITGIVDLPETGGANLWRTLTIKGLNLTAGYQTLKVETVAGGYNFYEMQFRTAENESITMTDNFENAFSDKWNFSDGDWAIESGQANVVGCGKRTLGNTGWTDYTIETDVKYVRDMNAGIIFRVNNPAAGGENNDPRLGTDFFQGYMVSLTSTSVNLGKHNYSWTHLTSASGSYSLNTLYHLKVVVAGANIKVYVEDMSVPKIDYTDTNPFINGKVGLRSYETHARFDNFTVTTSEGSGTSINEVSIEELAIYPNPVSDVLTVNTSQEMQAKVYSTTGQLLISQTIGEDNNKINVESLTKGVYILKLYNNGIESTRKFIKQ